ncbi:hypothetical protein THOG11_10078 [Vibrio harveyi]|nr:hypothetical protein VCHENC01_1355 [Vibrio harveyi]CAH1199867.1 hypothetical protein TH15OA1_180078 [Vibrio harveyi]CAH1526829.1 hypothetical protein VHARVF571_180155 [Vibrio harveyi]CAH1547508.1 hypothetical protein THOD03_10080 [Vibrio harveyi]CAH1548704.1 hypothetical protein THOG11_10078 [Vibrio harveyi]
MYWLPTFGLAPLNLQILTTLTNQAIVATPNISRLLRNI